jgi:hypothetical protein
METNEQVQKPTWAVRVVRLVDRLDWASNPETRHALNALRSNRRRLQRRDRVRQCALNFILNHRHA